MTFESCTFRENESGVSANGATATIRDCVFLDNSRAVAKVENVGGLIMENCVVERNELGVDCRWHSAEGTVEVRDCVFHENDTFAIWGSGDPVIERCRIQGNGGAGIFLEHARNVVVRDCLITGNGSHGLKVWDSFPVSVERCTISSNRPSFSGGALHVVDGTVAVSHSILWGNCSGDGWEVWQTSGSSIDLSCVNVQVSKLRVFGEGTLTMTDVLEADPLFCAPLACESAPSADGSWALDPASPALHQPCGPMGVPGPLCPAAVGVKSGVRTASWAQIKSRYR